LSLFGRGAHSSGVREAKPKDVPRIWELIRELAEYEKLGHAVVGSPELLKKHLFAWKVCGAFVAVEQKKVVGYCLYFRTYSTFRTQPGIWLEDLYVTPSHRRKGHGRALLQHLRNVSEDEGYGRLEWSVLDWNQSAIDFYRSMGADVMPDWRICRIGLGERGLGL
jgi:GNAT superfamily N-acetyltransferase